MVQRKHDPCARRHTMVCVPLLSVKLNETRSQSILLPANRFVPGNHADCAAVVWGLRWATRTAASVLRERSKQKPVSLR